MAFAMLYYGSERTMPDVPEVNVKMNGSTVIHLECNDVDCKWYADVLDPSEVDDLTAEHKQWHEDGMPA